MEIDYNFIKSEEAKQIYIAIIVRKFLKEFYDYSEKEMDKVIKFKDLDKKLMVEVFMDECQKLRTDFDYASMKFQENQAQCFLDRDYFLNLKKLLDELYALKTSRDPEYMYEKLFAEQTRQFDFFTKNCLYDGDEDPAELFIKEFVTEREV